MNKPLVTGLMISAAFVTAGGAVAGLGIEHGPRYAKVLAVQPVRSEARVNHEVCDAPGAAKRARRCRTVSETKQVFLGYDVRYQLGREIGTVRTDRPPGARLRIENGVAVTPDAADAGGAESG